MLDGYRRGLTTEQVFRQALKVEPAAFDEQFDKWLRATFREALRRRAAGVAD